MGDRILSERTARGLSRQQLVDKVAKLGAKIHATTIQKLEERASERSRYAREIALALGVNHDWLMTGKGPKDLGKSIDRKLQLFPPEDFDDVYDIVDAIVEQQLSKRNVR